MQLSNIPRTTSLLSALAVVTLGLTARAVSPPPDGGYPGQNTAEGDSALFSLTGGVNNTAMGWQALYSDTGGSYNTAIGITALFNNTIGMSNTATGQAALQLNTTGNNNTATGVDALYGNNIGEFNTATGVESLYSNSTGSYNTAIGGFQTLFTNTTGSNNTGIGSFALQNNNADNETAVGSQALSGNTTGVDNTAMGFQALQSNTTGFDNTANGSLALQNNVTGFDNTATGRTALHENTGSRNTADGFQALLRNTSGESNIALGVDAGSNLTTGNNNIDIGNVGLVAESGKIRIGTKGVQKGTFIAGISGATIASGVGVIINTQGQLGTVVSSARYKDAIHPMDKESESILALMPVTFQYKHELDPEGIPQFGLVAEDVEKVNPDLVARDEQGKAYTVRYDAVNAMLLNEFLKEHRKVEALEATVVQQQKGMAIMADSLRKQALQIESVSERLNRSTPLQVVEKQ